MTAVASRRTLAGLVALAALVALALPPFVPWLVERWRAPDGFFSHGPLVPIAAGWMAWRRRDAIARALGPGDWRGLLLVVPALALLVGATMLRFDSPAVASLLLLLPGLCWLLGGARFARELAAPLAFLAFAVPWPMELLAGTVQALKLLVVAASAALVNLFGAGVVAEGSFLVLPGGDRLLVDDECSGLKSALALLALGTFMAATARGVTRRQRVLFVALALPIAIVANVLRVALLAVVARAGGVERARAWHDPSTWGVYALVLLAYVLLERRLRRPAAAPAASELHPVLAPGGARLGAALLLVGAGVGATWQLHRPAAIAGAPRLATVPATIGRYQGHDLEVTERQQLLLETRDVLLRAYRDGDEEVLACVAVAGPSSKSAHPPEVCYRGQGWDVLAQTVWDARLAGRERPLSELVIEQAGARELVWSWYRVGEEETESWWREQWLAVRARLGGRDVPNALLRFSTRIAEPGGAEEQRAAQARLVRFLERFLPIADAALAAPAPDREAAAERARTR